MAELNLHESTTRTDIAADCYASGGPHRYPVGLPEHTVGRDPVHLDVSECFWTFCARMERPAIVGCA